MSTPHRGTLRSRLLLFTTTLLAAAVTLMGIRTTAVQREELRDSLQKSLEARGRALVVAMRQPCLTALSAQEGRDDKLLDLYVEDLVDVPGGDVLYVDVLNESLKVVSSSQAERYNQTATSPLLRRALATGQLEVQGPFRPTPDSPLQMHFAAALQIGQLTWGAVFLALNAESLVAPPTTGFTKAAASALLLLGPLVLILYIYVSRTVLGPVLAVTEGMRRVQRGNLSQEVVPVLRLGPRDDLTDLTQGFNTLQTALRDRERLREELDNARQHKLEALAQLVAGVAHEINNPANFLLQSLELYRQEHLSPEALAQQQDASPELTQELLDEQRQLVQIMTDGAQRIVSIVTKMRDFATIDRVKMEPVELLPVLEATLSLTSVGRHPGVKEVREWQALPTVRADGARLGQVLLNLTVNALQAMPDGGVLTVRTSALPDRVVVEIEDTGVGIPEALQARIFEPFFTTREVGGGTGIGLAVSAQIVHQHGGRLTVRSIPGRGSCFRMELPTGQLEPVRGTSEA